MDIFCSAFADLDLLLWLERESCKQPVKDAICRNRAVHFCAIGGAGALACQCITSCEVIAFEDLGCESVKRLIFKDFPLIVANDCAGGDIFERAR